MERAGRNKWRSMRFLPWGEGLEGRQLLSGSWPPYLPHGELKALLNNPVGNPAVRPNTPVLPFGCASYGYNNPHGYHFIDPSVHSYNRNHVYNYISPHVY